MIDPKVFKQVRKRLGLSQQELGDALGLSRVTVNKMERGRLARGIPDEIAERLLKLGPQPDMWPCLKGALRHQAAPDDTHLWDNEEDES